MKKITEQTVIAFLALAGIVFYLLAHFILSLDPSIEKTVLCAVLVFGGIPLLWDLLKKLFSGEFGSDHLAGISIVTAGALEEYLAGVIVVLMLSGGVALENMAVRRASSVLEALSKRMPNKAHRKFNDSIEDVPIEEIQVGDKCVVFPHEICPVDGIVMEGHSTMDESYLTGEPFVIPKTQGAAVISGAINGQEALLIRACRRSADSRYAKIMQVMSASAQSRPKLKRLADQLGGWYTPLAVGVALWAWALSMDPHRFLSVLVIATPCPLLIAIPVAIIGAISLSAKRGIIIKDPAVLEQIDECRIMILDKTGTLTYGQPQLTDAYCFHQYKRGQVLQYAASLERYSKHPLAGAILEEAKREGLPFLDVSQISERPGDGLKGKIGNDSICITGWLNWCKAHPQDERFIPVHISGLECVVAVNGQLAGLLRFHDKPRREGKSFIEHLMPRHQFKEVLIVSGDREVEVRYLADQMGIEEIHAHKTPEEKVQIVKAYTRQAKTVYVGDGINDGPALLNATVGIAFGHSSDVTSEAAGAVVMESSLEKVDELFHISRRLRRIALQSAIGGMALSIVGMMFASWGMLTPVAGAIGQELIDLGAVLNALRVSRMQKKLTDF